jgi:hypothetical protein
MGRTGEESVQGFWWETSKERDHSEEQGVDGRMESECILAGWEGARSGFSCLRIGTIGRLL